MMIFRQGQTTLNEGWHFTFEGGATVPVTLPHTWNATDTMDTDAARHYRRGQGIYELAFSPNPVWAGQRIWLEFEAVSQRGWVYFDDVLLAEHHGGYTAFGVEIPNRAGRLKVIADNTPDPDLIPSDMSDFFLYGGITRNVWLYTTAGAWVEALQVQTHVAKTEGQALVKLQIAGNVSAVKQVRLSLMGVGFDASVDAHVEAVIAEHVTVAMPPLHGNAYQRWSPDAPNLYRLNVALEITQASDTVWQSVEEVIGFRLVHFPAGGTFSLNGERLLLRGTHRHEDWAGYGGAVPDAITRHEFEQIKAAGFNFVRLGHYPQSRAALKACDELGLIVWEELPWCRGGVGEERFKGYTRAMLHEMITQHINHPSIVFWGLGNELDWDSEHPHSTDARVIEFLTELHTLTHTLDPSRLTALRRFELGATVVDVYSPSIWAGWYRGNYQDYEQNLTQALARYPRMIHAEWGGDSHAGRHREAPHIPLAVGSDVHNAEVAGVATSSDGEARYSKDGDWSESYIIDLMEWHLRVQARLANFSGGAQWVFKDFGTPLRPENPVPYINQKGLLDRDGHPKDVYALFCARQTQTPVVHIESNAWGVRPAEQVHQVRVISNLPAVELWIDGVSYGRKTADDRQFPLRGLVWEVRLRTGEHRLEAVGEDTRHCIRSLASLTDDRATAFTVTQGEGYIAVQLTGNRGYPVLNDERTVRFIADSPTVIQQYGGVMGANAVVETANGYAWVRIAPNAHGLVAIQAAQLGQQQITLASGVFARV